MTPCYRHILSTTRATVKPQPGHRPPAPKLDQSLPDISGAAPFTSQDQVLVVHDLKEGDDSPRLGLLETETGALTPLQTRWSGRIGRDIEALAKLPDLEDRYLAVEASSWRDRKARLHELTVNSDGAEATRSHVLPDFGQEIEGMAEKELPDGRRLVVLGGRGTDNGADGRLYWGTLDSDSGTLSFNSAGLHGVAVQAPDLPGDQQRDISDLFLAEDGRLWATTCTDNGNQGPFDSAVYCLGSVGDNIHDPLRPAGQFVHPVAGTKLEALTAVDADGLYLGSDNEDFGGQWGYLAFDCSKS